MNDNEGWFGTGRVLVTRLAAVGIGLVIGICGFAVPDLDETMRLICWVAGGVFVLAALALPPDLIQNFFDGRGWG